MRVSSVSNIISAQNRAYKPKEISFGSIYADQTVKNSEDYAIYAAFNPDFNTLKTNQTRIFRELASQIAISRLIDPDKKTNIRILGSSDGSEVWGYAIVLKEQTGDKAKKNVKITGIDINQDMVDLGRTGKIVCSDIEKIHANNSESKGLGKSPVAGDNWDKYLTKTVRPENFEHRIKENPYLRYLEYDPIVKKRIDRGLNWYEVNKDGLPVVRFKQGDMADNLSSDKKADCEVYVMANSSGYVLHKDPMKFLSMFETIKRENKGKDVFVVLGGLEMKFLYDEKAARFINMTPIEQEAFRDGIKLRGFEPLDEKELEKAGVDCALACADRIYRMKS